MTFQSLRQHRILLAAVLSTVVVGVTAFVVMMTIGNLTISKANVTGAVVMFLVLTVTSSFTAADKDGIGSYDEPYLGSALIVILWPIALALIVFCIETNANAWWEWGIFCVGVSLTLITYFLFSVDALWDDPTHSTFARA